MSASFPTARLSRSGPLSSRATGSSALLALVLGLLGACGDAAAKGEERSRLVLLPGSTPSADARPYYHDFGAVPDGTVAEHVFRLQNDSPKAVQIQRLVPSCGCTVPKLRAVLPDGTQVAGKNYRQPGPLLEVPPGAVCEVHVRIETEHVRPKNTPQLLNTALTSDADENAFVHLETTILVERPFDVLPGVLSCGRVPRRVGGRASVDVVPALGFPHRVSGVREVSPGWSVELEELTKLDRLLTRVTATLEPSEELGPRRGRVVLDTVDGEGNPTAPVEIGMTAEMVLEVVCDPARLILIADRAAETAAVTEGRIHSLIPGQKLRLAGATLSSDLASAVDVELVPVEPDADGAAFAWLARLSTRAPVAEERLEGELLVRLEQHALEELRIPVLLHLR